MKTRLILPALLATAVASQAAVTSIQLGLSRSDDTTSLGTIVNTTKNAGGSGGAGQSALYTVTGLSLDSVGLGDDEITFTLDLLGFSTATPAFTVNGIGALNGAWGVASGNGGSNSKVESDEALGFSFGGATVTLGPGATESAMIVFDGFTGFRTYNVGGGEMFDITGTAANDATNQSVAASGDLYSFTGLETGFTIEGNTGEMRYKRIQTSVTVTTVPIPEPSAALLGAFGILALLRRRRR